MNKILLIVLLILGGLMTCSCAASNTVTVSAQTTEIANDLDLKAIASAFGSSSSVEQFEEKLNDQNLGLSNLDLNGDGEVDYLRCIESGTQNSRYILIQAVLALNVYQDIANIVVEKDNTGNISTKVVGDSYIYGPNYIICPVYIYRPAIYNWFWGPQYVSWRSPYYWGYYPAHYRHYPHCYYHDYQARIRDYHRGHPNGFNQPRQQHKDIQPVRPAHQQPTGRTEVKRQVVSGPDHRQTTKQSGVQQRVVNSRQQAQPTERVASPRVTRTVQTTSNRQTTKTINVNNRTSQNVSKSTRVNSSVNQHQQIRTSNQIPVQNRQQSARIQQGQQQQTNRQSGSSRR